MTEKGLLRVGIIGTVVPVAEAQQVPFAFESAPDAHKAIDGPFGR